MSKSYMVSIRFSYEYDEDTILLMEKLKGGKLSKILRNIIRESIINHINETVAVEVINKPEIPKQNNVLKWNMFN